MGFSTYGGAVVVSPVGQPSLVYIIRQDINQIAALDTSTPGPVDFAAYYSHTFTGNEAHRNLRKKVVRITVFGEGEINPAFGSAYMIVGVDDRRTDVYPYSELSPFLQENILWRQNTMNLQGYQIDVALLLTGSGIRIREILLEYTPVG